MINNKRLICILLASVQWASGQAQEKPNIIFLMTDDQGWGDVGYNGHPHIKTPHLDDMAAKAMRFDRFYAGASVCSPTRAGAVTGRNNWRMNMNSPANPSEAHVPREELTIAEALKPIGYRTGHFGKWHIGGFDKENSGIHFRPPWETGFDVTFSTRNVISTMDPYRKPHKYGDVAMYWDNGHVIPHAEGSKREDLQGDDAAIVMNKTLEFVRDSASQKKPFLALVWFHNVHTPLGLIPEHNHYKELDQTSQVYNSNITAVDHQVGRLRAELEKLGVRNNTMLWFASDNGPNLKGKKNVKMAPAQGGKFSYTPIGSTGAYRGWKRSCYEGGLIVPGLLEWPAMIKHPVKTSHCAVTSDYFPTVLDAVGIPLPTDRAYDGVSLMPLIRGEVDKREKSIGFYCNGMEAWTSQKYKVVRETGKKGNNKWELYDLVNDPFEESNIADQFPQQVAKMDAEFQQWAKSCMADQQKVIAKYPPVKGHQSKNKKKEKKAPKGDRKKDQ